MEKIHAVPTPFAMVTKEFQEKNNIQNRTHSEDESDSLPDKAPLNESMVRTQSCTQDCLNADGGMDQHALACTNNALLASTNPIYTSSIRTKPKKSVTFHRYDKVYDKVLNSSHDDEVIKINLLETIPKIMLESLPHPEADSDVSHESLREDYEPEVPRIQRYFESDSDVSSVDDNLNDPLLLESECISRLGSLSLPKTISGDLKTIIAQSDNDTITHESFTRSRNIRQKKGVKIDKQITENDKHEHKIPPHAMPNKMQSQQVLQCHTKHETKSDQHKIAVNEKIENNESNQEQAIKNTENVEESPRPSSIYSYSSSSQSDTEDNTRIQTSEPQINQESSLKHNQHPIPLDKQLSFKPDHPLPYEDKTIQNNYNTAPLDASNSNKNDHNTTEAKKVIGRRQKRNKNRKSTQNENNPFTFHKLPLQSKQTKPDKNSFIEVNADTHDLKDMQIPIVSYNESPTHSSSLEKSMVNSEEDVLSKKWLTSNYCLEEKFLYKNPPTTSKKLNICVDRKTDITQVLTNQSSVIQDTPIDHNDSAVPKLEPILNKNSSISKGTKYDNRQNMLDTINNLPHMASEEKDVNYLAFKTDSLEYDYGLRGVALHDTVDNGEDTFDIESGKQLGKECTGNKPETESLVKAKTTELKPGDIIKSNSSKLQEPEDNTQKMGVNECAKETEIDIETPVKMVHYDNEPGKRRLPSTFDKSDKLLEDNVEQEVKTRDTGRISLNVSTEGCFEDQIKPRSSTLRINYEDGDEQFQDFEDFLNHNKKAANRKDDILEPSNTENANKSEVEKGIASQQTLNDLKLGNVQPISQAKNRLKDTNNILNVDTHAEDTMVNTDIHVPVQIIEYDDEPGKRRLPSTFDTILTEGSCKDDVTPGNTALRDIDDEEGSEPFQDCEDFLEQNENRPRTGDDNGKTDKIDFKPANVLQDSLNSSSENYKSPAAVVDTESYSSPVQSNETIPETESKRTANKPEVKCKPPHTFEEFMKDNSVSSLLKKSRENLDKSKPRSYVNISRDKDILTPPKSATEKSDPGDVIIKREPQSTATTPNNNTGKDLASKASHSVDVQKPFHSKRQSKPVNKETLSDVGVTKRDSRSIDTTINNNKDLASKSSHSVDDEKPFHSKRQSKPVHNETLSNVGVTKREPRGIATTCTTNNNEDLKSKDSHSVDDQKPFHSKRHRENLSNVGVVSRETPRHVKAPLAPAEDSDVCTDESGIEDLSGYCSNEDVDDNFDSGDKSTLSKDRNRDSETDVSNTQKQKKISLTKIEAASLPLQENKGVGPTNLPLPKERNFLISDPVQSTDTTPTNEPDKLLNPNVHTPADKKCSFSIHKKVYALPRVRVKTGDTVTDCTITHAPYHQHVVLHEPVIINNVVKPMLTEPAKSTAIAPANVTVTEPEKPSVTESAIPKSFQTSYKNREKNYKPIRFNASDAFSKHSPVKDMKITPTSKLSVSTSSNTKNDQDETIEAEKPKSKPEVFDEQNKKPAVLTMPSYNKDLEERFIEKPPVAPRQLQSKPVDSKHKQKPNIAPKPERPDNKPKPGQPEIAPKSEKPDNIPKSEKPDIAPKPSLRKSLAVKPVVKTSLGEQLGQNSNEKCSNSKEASSDVLPESIPFKPSVPEKPLVRPKTNLHKIAQPQTNKKSARKHKNMPTDTVSLDFIDSSNGDPDLVPATPNQQLSENTKSHDISSKTQTELQITQANIKTSESEAPLLEKQEILFERPLKAQDSGSVGYKPVLFKPPLQSEKPIKKSEDYPCKKKETIQKNESQPNILRQDHSLLSSIMGKSSKEDRETDLISDNLQSTTLPKHKHFTPHHTQDNASGTHYKLKTPNTTSKNTIKSQVRSSSSDPQQMPEISQPHSDNEYNPTFTDDTDESDSDTGSTSLIRKSIFPVSSNNDTLHMLSQVILAGLIMFVSILFFLYEIM